MTASTDRALAARLKALFLDELDEQLERLESGLEELAAAQPETPPGTVAELFRAAHSLKGAAQAVGSPVIAGSCHELEEQIGDIRDGAPLDAAAMARLQRLVDAVAGHRAQAAGEVGAVAGAVEDPSPSGPQEQAPVPGAASPRRDASRTRVGAGTRPVRVPSHKIDALTDQAGDLITASYSSQAFLDRLASLEERLLAEENVRHRERAEIRRLLADHPGRAVVGTVLDREDDRQRTTLGELGEVLAGATTHARSLRAATTRFAEASRRARMVPFEHATSGLHRQVRDLCDELGKESALQITASEVEVDKELVLTLRETLGHLVRNAVDHGIETPRERSLAGKSAAGTVRIDAALTSDGIRIEVSDDGRGADEEALRIAAVTRSPERHDGREPTLVEAMFAPGVSTAPEVTSVSGRGVGLDAVRAAVESTGGNVVVRSEAGQGITVTLSLPLNLSTMRALLVRVGDQRVCFPSASVRRLVDLPAGGARLGPGAVVPVDDQVVPVARLANILGWQPQTDRGPGRNTTTALLAPSDAGLTALAVDEVLTEREIVVRASSRRLDGVRTMLGTAQLDDGSLVLVVNPQVCLRAVVTNRSPAASSPAPDRRAGRAILLAEDSLTTRELERSMLEAAGHSVVVANDGQQAWELLQTHPVDAVVSDINMPRMDGIALCRAIRASNRLGSLPVVLVTSLHTEADRRAGLDAGADAYLTKSGFNREELLATLERLL